MARHAPALPVHPTSSHFLGPMLQSLETSCQGEKGRWKKKKTGLGRKTTGGGVRGPSVPQRGLEAPGSGTPPATPPGVGRGKRARGTGETPGEGSRSTRGRGSGGGSGGE